MTEVLGFAAGIFTTLAVVPQIWKAVTTRQADDISPVMYFVLIAGLAMWATYGIIKNDLPIVIFNGIGVVLNSILLFIYYYYGNNAASKN